MKRLIREFRLWIAVELVRLVLWLVNPIRNDTLAALGNLLTELNRE